MLKSLRASLLVLSFLMLATSICGAANCKKYKIHPNSLPNGFVNVAYGQQLTTSGGGGTTFSLSSGTLPTGLNLTSGGLISGTPTATGVFAFQIQFQNPSCTKLKNYTITINQSGCPPIALTPFSVSDATLNVFYSQAFSASGGAAPYTYNVVGGSLPTGLSLDSSTGLASGTPTVVGSYGFTITATDANGCIGQEAYIINVNCPLITLSPTSLPPTDTSTAYSQTITASGGVGSYTFAVTAGALPAGLSLDPSGAITGTATSTGSFSFTITATDTENCTGTQDYVIVVNAPTCSVITLSPASLPDAVINAAYDQQITANGGTPAYSFSITNGILPAGLAMDTTGHITGSATATGNNGFTVTVTDANNCEGSAAYAINVDCPTFTFSPPSLPSGTVGAAYSQTITPGGGTAPYAFDVIAGSLPFGTLLDPAAGTISGTPSLAGSYSFLFEATDNNSCAGTHLYSIDINDVTCSTITLLPATLPDGFLGTAYSQTISASGGTGNYNFSISGGTVPPGLSLDASTGVLSGTPNLGGSYSFTISATDNKGCIGTISYSVTISGLCPANAFYCEDWSSNTADGWTDKPVGLFKYDTGAAVVITSKKAQNFSPNFGGCAGADCTFRTSDMEIDSAGGRISLFAWFADSQHYVEVRLSLDKHTILIQQKSVVNGLAVRTKKKISYPVTLKQSYDVAVNYSSGTNAFTITVDGITQTGLTITAVDTPKSTGNAKLLGKSTTGLPSTFAWDDLEVYPETIP